MKFTNGEEAHHAIEAFVAFGDHIMFESKGKLVMVDIASIDVIEIRGGGNHENNRD